MRFGDIQRIRVRDISLTQHALRGSCWATKTTKLGQPWACTLFGRDEKSSWVLFWLRSLPSPDFLLPALACINKETPACFQGPMAYTQALALLRWAIQLPWMPRTASNLNQDEAQAYTLHSLKAALLSASAQLRLPEESRRQQGHHRLSSVQLYSRDDTIESLWVQLQIASALIRGWRPTRPQSRGGRHAVFEPAFSVGAGPIPTSITLPALPAELKMFIYEQEQQAQPCAIDPEAWAVQEVASSSDSDTPDLEEGNPHDAPPASCPSATCLVQLAMGAAVRAVYSSREDLPSAFCAACGLGITNPVHCINYLGQEHLCKHKACQHVCSLMP